jgi:hypothetical protein
MDVEAAAMYSSQSLDEIENNFHNNKGFSRPVKSTGFIVILSPPPARKLVV